MRTAAIITVALLLSACEPQARGFSLPPGDVDRGRAAFVELGCAQCHKVVGEPELEVADPRLEISLGGRTTRVKTYGDLVTSIINPSHRISATGPGTTNADGTSTMRVYNDVMTVQQLVDLVTFLQDHYEIYIPQTHFPTYP